MIKVLAICHGNICRSPMCEFILKDMIRKKGREDEFYIESCATSTEEIGRSLHPGAKRKLDEMGIPNERRRARQLTRQDYDKFDYLLCMDEWNVRNIMRIIKKTRKRRCTCFSSMRESSGRLPIRGTPAILTRPTTT